MLIPPTFRRQPLLRRTRGWASRWVGAAALCLALAPIGAWAQTTAPSAGAPAEEKSDSSSGSARVAPPSDVEVIRIKGRAVTGIETEVPASVTQFQASDLQALGAQNVSDLAKVTPNVEIKTTGSTAPTFFIRGVGLSDFSANAAGAVAIYRDDAPINAPAIQLTPLYDLENVVVDRGPQATGDGRNASAGAIRLYSRKPTGDLTAELRSSFGNYDFKDFEGAVEAPLLDEVLSARLAFRLTERGPTTENRCGNKYTYGQTAQEMGLPFGTTRAVCNSLLVRVGTLPLNRSAIPNGLPDGVNDVGNWAARGVFRFQPPDVDMDWVLNVHGSRLDQLSTLGQAFGTNDGRTIASETLQRYRDQDVTEQLGDLGGRGKENLLSHILARDLDLRPYSGDYNRVGDTTLDAWGATLRGDWTLGSVTLSSISDYETYDRFRDTDQDFTPDVLFEAVAEDDAWQFYQELKAHGELTETPFRWDLGGYYLMEELNFADTSFFQTSGGVPIDRAYTQKIWSYAAYASFAWDFLDEFTLEGGVRWNWDRKDINLVVIRPTATNPSDGQLINSSPTGTITLNYRFSEDVSAYWKYSHGWKPGTFNTIAQTCSVGQPQCGLTFAEPETIDAWETGLRGSWLDGRIQGTGSLFYYKYANYQVFVVADASGAPPTLQIVNANDAQVYGAEVEFRVEPLVDLVPPEIEGLVLSTRGGWLQSQFLDFVTVVTRATQEGIIEVQRDFSGNQLINSPRFKLSAVAEWTFDLGRFGAIIPRYDFAWSSDIYFDPNEGRGAPNAGGTLFMPKYAVGQRRYWIHNVRLGYRVPEGNIEIAGWCRNCTNTVYKTYAFDASGFNQVVINFLGEPRTYGLDLTIRF